MGYLRIDELLKEKGITGKSLANSVGISTTSMSAIINNKSQPRFELLEKISKELDTDIRDLFVRTKTDNKEDIIKRIKEYLDLL